MSLRFSPELRARVRRFAKTKGLEEATAVRLLCTERLSELDVEAERRHLEKWQDEEAVRIWEKLVDGETRIAHDDALEKVFAEARTHRRRAV